MEIKIEDIKDGEHFWAKFNNGEIAVLAKVKGVVYGCGRFDDDIPFQWFKVIEIINPPIGCEDAIVSFL